MNHILRHQTKRLGLTHQVEAFLISRAAEAMHTLLRYWPSKRALRAMVTDVVGASLIGLCIGIVIQLLLYTAFG